MICGTTWTFMVSAIAFIHNQAIELTNQSAGSRFTDECEDRRRMARAANSRLTENLNMQSEADDGNCVWVGCPPKLSVTPIFHYSGVLGRIKGSTAARVLQSHEYLAVRNCLCRLGCAETEDDYHIFVMCPKYRKLREDATSAVVEQGTGLRTRK